MSKPFEPVMTAEKLKALPNRFLNLFRSFPEFSQAEGELSKACKCNIRFAKGLEESRGQRFKDFALKQPEAVSSVLFKLDEQIKRQREPLKEYVGVVEAVRTEFSKVKTLTDDIKRKRKETEKIADRAAKTEKEVANAQRKIETERARGGGTGLAIAEERHNALVRQSEFDNEMKDKREQLQREEEAVYKDAIFEVILECFRIMREARAPAAAALAPVGDDIAAIAPEIPDTEETTIAELRAEIETLETEWAEVNESEI